LYSSDMRGKQCLLNYEGKHGSEQPLRRTESVIRLARIGAGWQTLDRALYIKLNCSVFCLTTRELRYARFDVLGEGGDIEDCHCFGYDAIRPCRTLTAFRKTLPSASSLYCTQWRSEGEGVLGCSNPLPPRNPEDPPKSCQTQPDCEN